MAEARASVAAVLTTDPAAIALTHSTTDGMNAITGRDPLAARRPRRHNAPGASRRARPALRAAVPRRRGRLRRHRRWRRRRPDARGGRGRHDAADAAGRRLARRCGPPGPSCRSRPWPISPTPAARSSRRRRAERRGPIPVDFERRGADAYAIAAQKWLLGPEGMGALAVRPELIAAAPAGVRGLPSASRRSTRWARPTSGPMPAGSSGERSTGRRSSAWPARSRGCRCTSGSTGSTRGGRRPRAGPPSGWRRSRASQS